MRLNARRAKKKVPPSYLREVTAALVDDDIEQRRSDGAKDTMLRKELTTSGGRRIGIEISPHSGHSIRTRESTRIDIDRFEKLGFILSHRILWSTQPFSSRERHVGR